ncbi:MAG: type II toxin-antitoxin system HicB family antitoxin [Thermodesulfobacteriota bacterium]|nr:type II toxin-antitoxin system HicB family antitoxin [Thermodesulfobacteriota bacterium]
MKNIVFSSRIFQEGDVYVSLCPELNVSSFGDTVEEAKSSLKEAVKLFVEECETMGTLEEVLEEAGYNKMLEPSEKWLPREPIVEEKLAIGA